MKWVERKGIFFTESTLVPETQAEYKNFYPGMKFPTQRYVRQWVPLTVIASYTILLIAYYLK